MVLDTGDGGGGQLDNKLPVAGLRLVNVPGGGSDRAGAVGADDFAVGGIERVGRGNAEQPGAVVEGGLVGQDEKAVWLGVGPQAIFDAVI